MQTILVKPEKLSIASALNSVPTMKEVAEHFTNNANHHYDSKRKERGEEALQAWQAFVADIKKRGIQEPLKVITAPKGQYEIVDGRHRFLAATEAGLTEVPCVQVSKNSVQDIIAGSIVGRRHFTKTARAWLAVTLNPKVANAGHGGDRKSSSENENGKPKNPSSENENGKLKSSSENELDLTQAELAAKFGVSTGLLSQVVDIYRKYSPSPDLLEQVTWMIWAGTAAGGVEAGMGFIDAAQQDPNKITKVANWNTALKAAKGFTSRLVEFANWPATEQTLFTDHLSKALVELPEEARAALAAALKPAAASEAEDIEEPTVAVKQPGKPGKKEILLTCPMCHTANFTMPGLKAHKCKANNGEQLSRGSLLAALPSN